MENTLSELKSCVDFGAADEAAWAVLTRHATPHIEALVRRLSARIEAHARSNQVDGAAQAGRIHALRTWVSEVLRAPCDHAPPARRMPGAELQTALGLTQRSGVGLISAMRAELQRMAVEVCASELDSVSRALHKVLDVELAIMLEQPASAEEPYRDVVERASALICSLDAQGRVMLFNSACQQLTGQSRDALDRASWVDVFVRASDRARVRKLLARTFAGHSQEQYEGPLQTKHGERLVRWQLTRLRGDVLCAIGIDVTQQHERDAGKRRAERLASLGTLAGGFAHELRNPLNSAKLQLNLARKRLSRIPGYRSDAQRALDLAEHEMQRMAALVEDFLVFARPHQLQLVELDLRTLVSEVLSVLEPEAAAAGVTLHSSIGGPSRLKLDATLMKQALLNLVRNAIEASAPNGEVRVSLRVEGGSAQLAVEDDGAGFALDAPIFEPFYTTKEGGTGLGLAIAHRIVMDHAGSLEAKTQPGHTEFVVKIPTASARKLSHSLAALHL